MASAVTNVGATVVKFPDNGTFDHFDKFAVRQVIPFLPKGSLGGT
jgi:hypothetical protein